ncbi:CoA transferase [Nonomuraea sp. NPDC000554]|uniref:CoA transferase n=1 Tax=Nonomuraea sp. NPDC000554 TaxID=3154259 RepID=UPI003327C443
MAHPATLGAARPLHDVVMRADGPLVLTAPAVRHLTALGVVPYFSDSSTAPGALTLSVPGQEPLVAEAAWSRAASAHDVRDEATAQAATGVMHVHGRRSGEPRGLAADYLGIACSVLTGQGLLAALIGRARGAAVASVQTGVDLAGLLAVSQYLAAATAEEDEAVPLTPGGPPFTSADGVTYEVETLDADVWVAFWSTLGVPVRVASAGWRSFQFRYATACSPLPAELHERASASSWHEVRRAAKEHGASVCALRSLPQRAAEPRADMPWQLWPMEARPSPGRPAPGDASRPLDGFTVLEAGRRIQAPLTSHLLGLLGARVIRIEPPGGDPLRGMPPTCGGVSARWLALNRGKAAVEIDIKSAAGRAELGALVADADVFVQNWAPGTAERLGLDSGDLAVTNPRLVYAYTSGWAGRLPDAPLGTDFMVQARTGVGDVVRPEGEPSAPSLMTLLDVLGGLLGAEAVLAGLLLREREGRGVRVDSSLLGAAELLTEPALGHAARGETYRRPPGFRQPLRTADGWVAAGDEPAAHADKVRDLGTAEAVAHLRRQGIPATAVTTSLNALPADPRFAAALTRDEHGALAVPVPWRFA